MRGLWRFPVKIVAVMAVAAAAMAVSVGTVRADVAERRAALEKVRDGLNDPDPLVRLITLEEVSTSEDALLRSMALRQAIGIADPDLQALAARMFFSGLQTFSLDLANARVTGGDDAKAKPILTQLQQTGLNFQVSDFDVGTGAFKIRFQAHGDPMDGQVTGTTVSFQTYWHNFANCRTSLRVGEALDLTGTIMCIDGGNAVTADVTRKFY
ncbi:hypothetical protein L2U69_16170 [Zavarzinia compransoris]|uniref:hypothetical protein n=1 Tax=Zavarzinia marina TaxID=2911065 RepID=UPI001F1DA19A|nr:hypothetical protein [Zavarzinia marina]MCF4167185.1 hypothetical protein [Zavarzinia marina]